MKTQKSYAFPRALVEESLRLAPEISPWVPADLAGTYRMNSGDCALIADGEGISVIDRETGEHRPATFKDWLEATLLMDALDQVGVYWDMANQVIRKSLFPKQVRHWRHIFSNFSKHVQDSSPRAEYSPWLLEILQAVFGDKETIRKTHPFSFLGLPSISLGHRRTTHRCLP